MGDLGVQRREGESQFCLDAWRLVAGFKPGRCMGRQRSEFKIVSLEYNKLNF